MQERPQTRIRFRLSFAPATGTTATATKAPPTSSTTTSTTTSATTTATAPTRARPKKHARATPQSPPPPQALWTLPTPAAVTAADTSIPGDGDRVDGRRRSEARDRREEGQDIHTSEVPSMPGTTRDRLEHRHNNHHFHYQQQHQQQHTEHHSQAHPNGCNHHQHHHRNLKSAYLHEHHAHHHRQHYHNQNGFSFPISPTPARTLPRPFLGGKGLPPVPDRSTLPSSSSSSASSSPCSSSSSDEEKGASDGGLPRGARAGGFPECESDPSSPSHANSYLNGTAKRSTRYLGPRRPSESVMAASLLAPRFPSSGPLAVTSSTTTAIDTTTNPDRNGPPHAIPEASMEEGSFGRHDESSTDEANSVLSMSSLSTPPSSSPESPSSRDVLFTVNAGAGSPMLTYPATTETLTAAVPSPSPRDLLDWGREHVIRARGRGRGRGKGREKGERRGEKGRVKGERREEKVRGKGERREGKGRRRGGVGIARTAVAYDIVPGKRTRRSKGRRMSPVLASSMLIGNGRKGEVDEHRERIEGESEGDLVEDEDSDSLLPSANMLRTPALNYKTQRRNEKGQFTSKRHSLPSAAPVASSPTTARTPTGRRGGSRATADVGKIRMTTRSMNVASSSNDTSPDPLGHLQTIPRLEQDPNSPTLTPYPSKRRKLAANIPSSAVTSPSYRPRTRRTPLEPDTTAATTTQRRSSTRTAALSAAAAVELDCPPRAHGTTGSRLNHHSEYHPQALELQTPVSSGRGSPKVNGARPSKTHGRGQPLPRSQPSRRRGRRRQRPQQGFINGVSETPKASSFSPFLGDDNVFDPEPTPQFRPSKPRLVAIDTTKPVFERKRRQGTTDLRDLLGYLLEECERGAKTLPGSAANHTEDSHGPSSSVSPCFDREGGVPASYGADHCGDDNDDGDGDDAKTLVWRSVLDLHDKKVAQQRTNLKTPAVKTAKRKKLTPCMYPVPSYPLPLPLPSSSSPLSHSHLSLSSQPFQLPLSFPVPIEVCDTCRRPGTLICCDTCPKVFHLYCTDPPILDEIPTHFQCRECEGKVQRRQGFTKQEYEMKLWGKLFRWVDERNPQSFDVPEWLKCYFRGVGVGDGGAFRWLGSREREQAAGKEKEDHLTATVQTGAASAEAIPLCYRCSLSDLRGTLISCDYCAHHFHLDCLNPPLTTKPATSTIPSPTGIHQIPSHSSSSLSTPSYPWMCPLHAAHHLEPRLELHHDVLTRVRDTRVDGKKGDELDLTLERNDGHVLVELGDWGDDVGSDTGGRGGNGMQAVGEGEGQQRQPFAIGPDGRRILNSRSDGLLQPARGDSNAGLTGGSPALSGLEGDKTKIENSLACQSVASSAKVDGATVSKDTAAPATARTTMPRTGGFRGRRRGRRGTGRGRSNHLSRGSPLPPPPPPAPPPAPPPGRQLTYPAKVLPTYITPILPERVILRSFLHKILESTRLSYLRLLLTRTALLLQAAHTIAIGEANFSQLLEAVHLLEKEEERQYLQEVWETWVEDPGKIRAGSVSGEGSEKTGEGLGDYPSHDQQQPHQPEWDGEAGAKERPESCKEEEEEDVDMELTSDEDDDSELNKNR